MNKVIIAQLAVAALLAPASFRAMAQSSSVQVTLSEQGQPVAGGLVVLQRIKDSDCVKLFTSGDASEKARKKAVACMADLPDGSTDESGKFAYQRLAPGWYDVRFLWSMKSAPDRSQAIACMAVDWAVFYEPGRDRTGKYDAMAQGKPFELKESEARLVSFDYRNQFEAENCQRRVVNAVSSVKSGKARISLPEKRGVLEIDPGQTTWNTTVKNEGKEIYLSAIGRRDHLLVTAFLTQVSFAASAEKCRDERWRNSEHALRSHKMDLGTIQKTTDKGVAHVEFFIDHSPAGQLKMKDVHAYMGSGDLCAEVHLSKVFFQPEDQLLFDEVLNSVRFLPDEASEESPKSQ